jgi:hypothetical protein
MMSTSSLRLPNSLHRRLAELAKRDSVSINQLITSAVAEKASALMTLDYLKERAARASRRKFAAVLDKVPRLDPEPADLLARASKRLEERTAGRQRGSKRQAFYVRRPLNRRATIAMIASIIERSDPEGDRRPRQRAAGGERFARAVITFPEVGRWTH